MHLFRTQLAKSKVKDATKGVVYACSDFTPWQRNALEFLQSRFNPEVRYTPSPLPHALFPFPLLSLSPSHGAVDDLSAS